MGANLSSKRKPREREDRDSNREGWFTPLAGWHSTFGGGKPAFLTEHIFN